MYLSNFVSVHQVQQQKYLFAITDWQWEQNVTSCQAARKAQAYWASYLWFMSIYNISKNMTRRKTRNIKARYAAATKSDSTRSTLLKVNCCRNRQQSRLLPYTIYVQLCCWFWQQVGNNVNSTSCCGWLCCRYGRLCCQCVRCQSETVDFFKYALHLAQQEILSVYVHAHTHTEH